jgi:SNF2 family DNA or RNA helicase
MSTPQFLKEHLLHCFDSATLKRGEGVFKQGKVLSVKQMPTPNFDAHSRLFQYEAEVLGSNKEHYDTRVTVIESDRKDNPLIIIGNCDCPVGDNCKHAAAVCYQLLNQKNHATSEPASNTKPKAKTRLDGMPPHEFEYLLNDLYYQADINDDPEEWYHFHLFNDTHQAWSDPKIPMTDLKIMRHHYTASGKLAKPKAMGVNTYFNQFSLKGYSEHHKIANLMRAVSEYSWQVNAIKFSHINAYPLLKALIETGQSHFQMQEAPLSWLSEPYSLTLEAQTQGELYQLGVPLTENQFLVLCDPPIIIDKIRHSAQRVIAPVNGQMLARLIQLKPLSKDQYNQLADNLQAFQQRAKPTRKYSPAPKPIGIQHKTIDCLPKPLLIMTDGLPYPYFVLSFIYDDEMIEYYPVQDVARRMTKNARIDIQRDHDTEQAAIERIADFFTFNPPYPGTEPQQLTGTLKQGPTNTPAGLEGYLALQDLLPLLEQEGWLIEGFDQDWLELLEPDEMRIESESKNDWFNLSFNLQVKGKTLPMAPILDSLLRGYDSSDEMPDNLLFQLNENEVLQIPKTDVAPLFDALLQLYQKKSLNKGLDIQPFDAHLIAGLANTPIKWLGDNKLLQLAEKLKNFTEIETIPAPPGLNATLRPYQAFGLSWLQFLYDHGFNGVLADDMGLGKTLQTLSWLLHLKQQGELSAPALLIVPTSLIGNWKSEAHKFTPDLKLLTLHGSERAEEFEQISQADIVLTTYPLLPRDVDALKEHDFKLLILDEAQKIKNPRTKLYAALMELKSAGRLCLTGTPVENHLGELWALFNFLMPGFLGNQMQFKQHYQKPIEIENSRQVQEQLTRKVAPFLLRRTKHQVVQELPDKTEIIKTVEFDSQQAKLYETIRVTMEEKVRQTVAEKGLAKSQITLLDALLKLRQVCCDPGLVKIDAAKKVKQSAKLELLMELLEDLLEGQHNVIIFSQFTSMLTIIGEALKKQGIAYSLLTGQTKQREHEINRFKNGETRLFLISLKAGGVGLNLTEADTVIHYDPWWNPAVENQATDRAYRIGQNREVFVYKLVVANTIEEKILQLQAKKQQLQDKLYEKGKTDDQGSMTLVADDLLELLKGGI